MQTVAALIYVGRRENAYDFTNNDGERIKGVKRTAYFADEANGYLVHELDVRENVLELYEGLKFGEGYRVTVEPRAKGNRVVYQLVDIDAL